MGHLSAKKAGTAQESGFAILSRQQQSDTGAITWHDNLNRAIMWQGKILLDLWPKLINSARVQRIVNPDDSIRHAVIYNSQNETQLRGRQEAAQMSERDEEGLRRGCGRLRSHALDRADV